MGGLITAKAGSSLLGIKLESTYINAIGTSLVL
jgi:hypothetical protein